MIDEKKLIQDRPEFLNEQQDISLQNEKGGYNKGWNDCLNRFIDIIDTQPKIDWISVDERLPEIDRCVLVSYKSTMTWDKKIYADQIAILREDGWHWWDELETKVENEIVAWWPLSEPYKGETE